MKLSVPTSQISLASVEVYIEELVLHGFAAGDRYAIAMAVEHELSRLFMAQFAAPSLPASFMQSSEQARVDAGAFNVSHGANRESIGNQIAQNVHRGLTR